ncbi:MAG: pyruvate, phosphate dikinase [Deltaproteobacteria bacterium HGW-Deltaproteobacteria-18]|nr:MAG: pyruvate, phosphate dikinase [Deltaproteobacteria bacterium HGW-Deltaproteobacteria-18]
MVCQAENRAGCGDGPLIRTTIFQDALFFEENSMPFFSKQDSCRLLADQDGPGARRFRHYDAFLEHNHRALRILAELEMLDRGAGLATLAFIQRRGAELLNQVKGLVESLNELSGHRYDELILVFDTVAGKLQALIQRERPIIDGPLTLPFPKLGAGDMPLSGAKAANLAQIANVLGLPAPDGFVVTTAGCDLFLRGNGLLESVEEMLAGFDPGLAGSPDACRMVREKILAAPLPSALEQAMQDEYLALSRRLGRKPELAVRSSAVGEDTAASFAGQYTSVLPVKEEDLSTAFRTVLASKYTPRAILYRLRYGLSDAATPMAVAAVDLVDAKASGVLYTVDPSTPQAGQARIDAALGLGEQVVGGSVSPDVFRVDRDAFSIVQRSIQPKGEEAQIEAPALADSSVIDLVRSGLLLEAHFGVPQDIEWAEDADGRIVFLQSRPLGIAPVGKPSPALNTEGMELVLSAGQTASPGRVSGMAVLVTADLTPEQAENAILVARTAAPDLAPYMSRVRGLITDLGGVASHLASVAREFNVPALMDTREATAKISTGQEITLLAEDGAVYLGLVPELNRNLPARAEDEDRGPIGRHLRELLERISPLNLTDPKAPEFTPKGCRTLHDLIRFAHEKAMEEMFNISRLAGDSVVSRSMSANIPLEMHFIDLGGGLAEGLGTCDEILPEHIRSKPMAALWRGLAHPGVTWAGNVDLSGRNFMALMSGSMGPGGAVPPQTKSYALVSAEYLNLSVKFGYHYSNLDVLCSDEPDANTLTLQFSGGAGTISGKALRIEFLSNVLERLGYEVSVSGDMLQAAQRGLDCPAMEEVLDQTGRLLGCSRLLDLAIPNQTEVQTLTEMFFRQEYDFLDRSEKRLPGFYASFGQWSLAEMDGREVIMQDGAYMGQTVSCALHSAASSVLGKRYRKFLEKRHARHYYPAAVKRDSGHKDGRITVDVRIEGGCVDLAAGVAFGLTNVGNCLVLAVDAAAKELQLLEFVNNTRRFLDRITIEVPLGSWLGLEVTVAGKEITAGLVGGRGLRFTAPRTVTDYVGLWTKGDTTAYFRNLETAGPVQEETRPRE